jgi:hypothetical protein
MKKIITLLAASVFAVAVGQMAHASEYTVKVHGTKVCTGSVYVNDGTSFIDCGDKMVDLAPLSDNDLTKLLKTCPTVVHMYGQSYKSHYCSAQFHAAHNVMKLVNVTNKK